MSLQVSMLSRGVISGWIISDGFGMKETLGLKKVQKNY